MTTNSRTGRQFDADRDAVFALALERTRVPAAPALPGDAYPAPPRALLCRLGKVSPLPDQVPPT